MVKQHILCSLWPLQSSRNRNPAEQTQPHQNQPDNSCIPTSHFHLGQTSKNRKCSYTWQTPSFGEQKTTDGILKWAHMLINDFRWTAALPFPLQINLEGPGKQEGIRNKDSGTRSFKSSEVIKKKKMLKKFYQTPQRTIYRITSNSNIFLGGKS